MKSVVGPVKNGLPINRSTFRQGLHIKQKNQICRIPDITEIPDTLKVILI